MIYVFWGSHCYIFGLCKVFTYVEKTQREKQGVCAKTLQLTTDNYNNKKANSKVDNEAIQQNQVDENS